MKIFLFFHHSVFLNCCCSYCQYRVNWTVLNFLTMCGCHSLNECIKYMGTCDLTFFFVWMLVMFFLNLSLIKRSWLNSLLCGYDSVIFVLWWCGRYSVLFTHIQDWSTLFHKTRTCQFNYYLTIRKPLPVLGSGVWQRSRITTSFSFSNESSGTD